MFCKTQSSYRSSYTFLTPSKCGLKLTLSAGNINGEMESVALLEGNRETEENKKAVLGFADCIASPK